MEISWKICLVKPGLTSTRCFRRQYSYSMLILVEMLKQRQKTSTLLTSVPDLSGKSLDDSGSWSVKSVNKTSKQAEREGDSDTVLCRREVGGCGGGGRFEVWIFNCRSATTPAASPPPGPASHSTRTHCPRSDCGSHSCFEVDAKNKPRHRSGNIDRRVLVLGSSCRARAFTTFADMREANLRKY